MRKNHTYFPRATAQQRQLLFETWEATKSVTQACARAHLSRITFYLWKPRFEEHGYAGLVTAHSCARENNNRTAQPIVEEVIAMHRANPDWGKKRIEQEMTKAHNWVAVVSPNTVRRILHEAGLWHETTPGKKSQPKG